MIHEKIFRLAAVIAQAGEEETPLLEALCTAAEAQTAQRLRKGCTAGDCCRSEERRVGKECGS